jgi:hypothetical protein
VQAAQAGAAPERLAPRNRADHPARILAVAPRSALEAVHIPDQADGTPVAVAHQGSQAAVAGMRVVKVAVPAVPAVVPEHPPGVVRRQVLPWAAAQVRALPQVLEGQVLKAALLAQLQVAVPQVQPQLVEVQLVPEQLVPEQAQPPKVLKQAGSSQPSRRQLLSWQKRTFRGWPSQTSFSRPLRPPRDACAAAPRKRRPEQHAEAQVPVWGLVEPWQPCPAAAPWAPDWPRPWPAPLAQQVLPVAASTAVEPVQRAQVCCRCLTAFVRLCPVCHASYAIPTCQLYPDPSSPTNLHISCTGVTPRISSPLARA